MMAEDEKLGFSLDFLCVCACVLWICGTMVGLLAGGFRGRALF